MIQELGRFARRTGFASFLSILALTGCGAISANQPESSYSSSTPIPRKPYSAAFIQANRGQLTTDIECLSDANHIRIKINGVGFGNNPSALTTDLYAADYTQAGLGRILLYTSYPGTDSFRFDLNGRIPSTLNQAPGEMELLSSHSITIILKQAQEILEYRSISQPC